MKDIFMSDFVRFFCKAGLKPGERFSKQSGVKTNKRDMLYFIFFNEFAISYKYIERKASKKICKIH